VGVAVLQAAVHRHAARLDAVRVHAEPVQPRAARGGAGDVRPARDQGVGSLPWSPLAKGRLAKPWGTQTQRGDTDPLQSRYTGEYNKPIVEAVQRIAEARDVPMAQVALAWVLHNPSVVAPIVGSTKAQHLADAVAALSVELTEEEITALEEPYTPRQPSGY
jgi:aryl-alcohol dehydrogenase-like predicted oxidoreductase